MNLMHWLAKVKFYYSRSMGYLALATTILTLLIFLKSYDSFIATLGIPMEYLYLICIPLIVVGSVLFGFIDYIKGTGKHESNLSWENTPIAMGLVKDAKDMRKDVKSLHKEIADLKKMLAAREDDHK